MRTLPREKSSFVKPLLRVRKLFCCRSFSVIGIFAKFAVPFFFDCRTRSSLPSPRLNLLATAS